MFEIVFLSSTQNPQICAAAISGLDRFFQTEIFEVLSHERVG